MNKNILRFNIYFITNSIKINNVCAKKYEFPYTCKKYPIVLLI